MQAPEQIQPQRLGDYLDVMSKAVFQSGISWKVVESKWPGTREAFKNFDAEAVAAFTEVDLDALTNDTRVIRNRRKLEGVVHNAGRMVELERKHGSFQAYLRSKTNFPSLVRDMREQFKFLGDSGAHYFLYVVGEEVPDRDTWMKSRRK